MTLYLIRHAQSQPAKSVPFSEWPLSPRGTRQAEQLVPLLGPLGVAQVFSSPFVRTLQTAGPFARRHGLGIVKVEDLRERRITNEAGLPSDEVWCRGWADFNFAPPGCETSLAAQGRICGAIHDIARRTSRTSAVFTHGNVIGLFLNALISSAGRKEAEALLNPDVLKLDWQDGVFMWDRDFRLAGLETIATSHSQTPREKGTQRNVSEGGAPRRPNYNGQTE
jgi:2,3-bisphosphoglycerate-dependent phosphoglycerate mutase